MARNMRTVSERPRETRLDDLREAEEHCGNVISPPRRCKWNWRGFWVGWSAYPGLWMAAAKNELEVPEREVVQTVTDFAPLWDELFPAEQARIVRLLVERIDLSPDGMQVRVRVIDGIQVTDPRAADHGREPSLALPHRRPDGRNDHRAGGRIMLPCVRKTGCGTSRRETGAARTKCRQETCSAYRRVEIDRMPLDLSDDALFAVAEAA